MIINGTLTTPSIVTKTKYYLKYGIKFFIVTMVENFIYDTIRIKVI